MRRLLDIVLASAGLLLGAPLLLAAAIAIRLDSGGPVIFRQERVGLGGEPFEILKFRTMTVAPPEAGPSVTSSGDQRITRVGRFLRSTKIDELPQLLNVVRGEMSLVGPRPEVPAYAAHWPDEQREVILSVRPGITDPASIAFRREAELLAEQADPETYYLQRVLPEKANLYVDYVENRSLARDMRLILSTLRAVAAD